MLITAKAKAFTMLEIVVVIGILVIVTAIVLPQSISEIRLDKVRNESYDFSSQLYILQQDIATGNRGWEAGGIAIFEDRYTIFKGNSLDSASDTRERLFELPVRVSHVSLSDGGNEIVFLPGDVRPVQSGSIRFVDGSFAVEIYINPEGVIISQTHQTVDTLITSKIYA